MIRIYFYIDTDFLSYPGLDNISSFTSTGWSVMRVEMEDDIGNTGYAQYGIFLVGGPTSEYKLTVSQYSGNAGCKWILNHNVKITNQHEQCNFLGNTLILLTNY